MQRITLVAAFGAALLLLAGCSAIDTGTSSPSTSSDTTAMPESCSGDEPFIAVALPNLTNPYYVAMKQGFEEAGAEAGFKIDVQIANDDDAAQLSQVETMLQKQPCALALNAVKSEPGAAIVSAANQVGVPVFTVNVGIDPDALKAQGASIMQYLGADNFAGGQQMGEKVLADLGADAQLSVGLVTEPDETPTVARDKGFAEALAPNSNAEVVASVDGNVKPDDSLKATTELLAGNPDINVIFASTGPATYGALQAFGDRTDIALYGFCAAEEPVVAPYVGCVAQEPESYGRQVIEQIENWIGGEKPEPEILLPLKVFGTGETPAPGEVG